MDWNRYLNPDFTLHSKIAPPSRRHGNIRGRDRPRTLPRAEPDLRKLAYKFCRRTNEAETPASQTPTESRMSGRGPPQWVEQPTTHRRPSRNFTKNTHQVPLSLFTEGEDSNRDVLEAAASARGARTIPRATANMITSPRRDKNLSWDTISPLPRSGDYVEDSQTRSTDDVNEEEEIEYVGQASRRPREQPGLRTGETSRQGSSYRRSMKAARKIAPEVSRDIFVDDVIELSDSDDEDKLASQLNELIERSGVIRRYGRPPFLRRNLWQIFLGQCKWAKISTSAEPRPSPPMLVIYRLENMPDSGDYTAKWECPFCDLYHQFNNRAMLDHHLRLDHSEVPVDWDFDQSEHRWTITCTIPQPPQPSDSSEEDEDEDDEEEEEEEEEDGEEEEDLLRGHNRDYDLPQFRPGELVDEPAQDIKPFYTAAKLRLHSPTPATIPLTNRQLRGSLPARFPTPPPPDDQLGPAARYPFLNYQGKADEMASPDNYQSYSCRPGGPRLFDLLNTMDLGEFGVLSWIIVDREEEIYEIDDVRDEDKVMLALWNRWIFMNRKSFIFKGFDNGIESFIEDHWRIIHLAAGWGALRAFLLMMYKHKFLTVPQVANLLKYYESLTGMDFWYK